MLGTLLKKKLNAERLANVFINSLLEVTEIGFEDVSQLIREDNAFISHPLIDEGVSDHFTMIVLVGNLRYLEDYFDAEDAREVKNLIIEKLSRIYDMRRHDFKNVVDHYDQLISRVNHPSKNTLYGMSKALFHKLKLNDYQESYFKSMKTPNPLFLKRMDDVMSHFLWDWDELFRKYRFSSN